jgi:hypothetical protein
MLKMSATFTLPKVYTEFVTKRHIRCKKSYSMRHNYRSRGRLDYQRKFLLCISRIISWWNIIFCMCHNKISQSFKSTAVQWCDIWAKPEVMNGKQTIYWPNNVVTHSCAARIRELLPYLVIRDIFLIMKLVN